MHCFGINDRNQCNTPGDINHNIVTEGFSIRRNSDSSDRSVRDSNASRRSTRQSSIENENEIQAEGFYS